MTHKDNRSDPIGGTPANQIAIPTLITFIILYLLVIFLFFFISRESRQTSAIMQKTGEYTSDATNLLAGSNALSETASAFILMPVNENGDINYSPLAGYASELKKDRRGEQVVERFNSYDVSDEDRKYITEAADAANAMMDAQLHALALMNSVYPFTDVAAVSSIPLPELTDKEKAYSDEKKVAEARQLILNTEYALNKQTLVNDLTACTTNMKKESAARVAATTARISQIRTLLWVVTVCMILLVAFTAVIIYQQILVPIKNITRSIHSNEPLVVVRGIREVREMAHAYNGLLHRRDALDSLLRSAAETDTLTKLPNRYAFRQYLLDSHEEGNTLGILMFDVNYLKQTNDTFGHKAGDELLKNSADCILTCFGSTGDSNCFRLGGDEFAAVIKNPTTELVDNEIKLFLIEQERRKLSISWGYALANETADLSFDELIETADKRMYEQKKHMHGNVAMN